MSRHAVLACLVIAVMTAVVAGQQANVTVNTPVGTFVGYKTNILIDGATVQLNKFLGIPYAEAPVGQLRFEKPVPKAAIGGPLLTQVHGSECIQVALLPGTGLPTSEDCLFLNIYAPDTTDNGGPLAVMIWIHGGGYVTGSANPYLGDLLATRGNVIVVTINYRLSVLGFLNLGRGKPSNFGLWDQQLAIQWVHDNIGAFGGDNGRVTIFGESAGSGSVTFQGIYPGNRGLFHRMIAESGTAGTPWSESVDPASEAEDFIRIVGCASLVSSRTEQCLKTIPAVLIEQTLNDPSNGLLRSPTPFVPSIDNDFIKVKPRDIFDPKIRTATAERNVLSTFDLLIGTNSGEGVLIMSPATGFDVDPENFLPNRTYFEETLVPLLVASNNIEGDLQAISKIITAAYTTWEDPANPANIRENFIDMHGDYQFLIPTALATDLHAQISTRSTYSYFFTAEPSVHLLPTPTWVDRPNHGDELQYVFGDVNGTRIDENPTGEFQEWEKELARNVMLMWSNFAKTGNPSQPRGTGVTWAPYTSSDKAYLDIAQQLSDTVTRRNLILDRVNMWDHVLPAVNEAVARAGLVCDDVTGANGAVMHKSTIVALMMFLVSLFYHF